MQGVLEGLNDMQKQAVSQVAGPLLLLAGAGSGKTKVITHRIAYLMENGVLPYNIMAITFTNKAAKEMKERAIGLIGPSARDVWIRTFHSSCVVILRRFIDRLGTHTNSFTIYDSDDSAKLYSEILKRMDVNSKLLTGKNAYSIISSAKNAQYNNIEGYIADNEEDPERAEILRSAYREYKRILISNNALDFDDLLIYTVKLLKEIPEVREYYHRLFHYIMVDEYQDTNNVQFEMVSLLVNENNNICVVGDDDQSIYKFRGANITNILNFEEQYEGTKVIKLEQNYRSSKKILAAAYGVVKNNQGRKEKKLWTENGDGQLIKILDFESTFKEAEYIARDISKLSKNGFPYSDFAILYRGNSQSRSIEEKLVTYNIPYKIFGGVSFYSRMEIKDMLAYLKVLNNPNDDMQIERIINVPKRGIGESTVLKLKEYAISNGLSLIDVINNVNIVDDISQTTKNRIRDFAELIHKFEAIKDHGVGNLLVRLFNGTNYRASLEEKNDSDSLNRIKNVEELIYKGRDYDESCGDNEPKLEDFLSEISLMTDLDEENSNEDFVSLMTLHRSKGLEFGIVYMIGMEQGVFPSSFSKYSPEELEEERRLCYVGITRAKRMLTLSYSKIKRSYEGLASYEPSIFLDEIPKELVDSPTSTIKEKRPIKDETNIQYTRIGNNISVGDSIPKKSYGQKIGVANKAYAGLGKNVASISNVNKKLPDYNVGDRVKHIKFGQGQVISIVDGGKDFEITVNFDRVGEKKLFAGLAKLKKI